MIISNLGGAWEIEKKKVRGPAPESPSTGKKNWKAILQGKQFWKYPLNKKFKGILQVKKFRRPFSRKKKFQGPLSPLDDSMPHCMSTVPKLVKHLFKPVCYFCCYFHYYFVKSTCAYAR